MELEPLLALISSPAILAMAFLVFEPLRVLQPLLAIDEAYREEGLGLLEGKLLRPMHTSS